jgi:nucleotide-binding universal stress UspA family protein
MFKKIAVAIAFSPRCVALLAEAERIRKIFDGSLIVIHIGDKNQKEEQYLQKILKESGVDSAKTAVFWDQGQPAKKILQICKNEHVDLLIAGALRKENLVTYYIGSVARSILRNANCSVLVFTEPSALPKPFEVIVVNAENSPYVANTINAACHIARKENSKWVHIIREIMLYGLSMSRECSEQEYSDNKRELVSNEITKVDELLTKIDTAGVKINTKVVAGKPGYELKRFAERVEANLLISGAPKNKYGLLDRFFPHDLEFIFADMPCNLLIINS